MSNSGPNKDNPAPRETENESRLPNTPICVKPKGPHHKLDPTSRLNYAKIYTVEHNVKVCFIGVVHDKSKAALLHDYNKIHPRLCDPAATIEEEEIEYTEEMGGPSGGPQVHPAASIEEEETEYAEEMGGPSGGPYVHPANRHFKY
jgi:hypothetical protein